MDPARKKYDRGEFVHSNIQAVTGGGPLNGAFYGETFIPESYIQNNYTEYFDLIKFGFAQGQSPHPFFFLKRKT